MAEITNDLMYQVLKRIQDDVAALKEGQREHNAALDAIRIHMVGMQQDTIAPRTYPAAFGHRRSDLMNKRRAQ